MGASPRVWCLTRRRWEPGEFVGEVAPCEAERAARFHRAADAGRFLASRALLRAVLSAALGSTAGEIVFDRTCGHCGNPNHGRPEVRVPATSALSFSLSRSGPLVAVAVAAAPVGLDLEAAGTSADELVQAGVFGPIEREWLRICPDDRRPGLALHLWVAKEAVGKASGRGLHRADEVRLPLEAPAARQWRAAADAEGGRCWLHGLEVSGAAAAALAHYGQPGAAPEVMPVTAIADVAARW